MPAAPVITAGKGGGSGEVFVRWDAVTGATGYQVLRAADPRGPFEQVADFDITTGATSADDDVVNVWSARHSYIPKRDALQPPDRSPWFEYVDVGDRRQRCYQVAAYNSAGTGPGSGVACGSPP